MAWKIKRLHIAYRPTKLYTDIPEGHGTKYRHNKVTENYSGPIPSYFLLKRNNHSYIAHSKVVT